MFGAPTTSTGFGSFGGFGTPAQPTSTFGQPANSTFSFGAKTTQPSFGSFAAQPAATTTTTSMFGQNPTTSTTSFGGFGTTPAFGTTAPSFNAGSAFGAPAQQTAAPFGAANTSFGGLGTSTAGSSFGFGGFGASSSGFGAGTGTSTFSFAKPATGAFGGTTGAFGATPGFGAQTGAFGAPTTSPDKKQKLQDATEIATAVTVPMIYQDERDRILALFNQLQAKWGVGKGFYNQSGQAVTFSPENPFCKFKTIAYNALPTYRAEEGLICLVFNKKIADMRDTTPTLTEIIHRDVIKAPSISVFLDSMTDMGNDQTQVVIYVYEKNPTGTSRKYTSTELLAALQQPTCKQALGNMGVTAMEEMVEINKTGVDQYLAVPPAGIDPLLWEQAKADNPNPDKMIPVPLVGFQDLIRRLKSQKEHQERQAARLELMVNEAAELEKKCEVSKARVEEFRIKQQDISHRVLKVMAAFEVNRKMGVGIKSEEERLRASLDEIQREIDILNHGKLCELQASIKSAPVETEVLNSAEDIPSDDVLQLLVEQQKGFASLIKIINEDTHRLDEIQKALQNSST